MAATVEPTAQVAEHSEQENTTRASDNGDKGKAGIRFKDAIGRTFNFPFHFVKTWAGMEALIKAAFQHVTGIGPEVEAGHYDLISPAGEIILPKVWEDVIEPGWSITMMMWPPKLKEHPLHVEKKAEGKSFTLEQCLVFYFPGDTDAAIDKEPCLALVLFPILFNRPAKSADIVLSCKLNLTSNQNNIVLEVAKCALFRPSPWFGYELLEGQRVSGSSGGVEFEASTTFRIESSKGHVFAVLVWRPRGEFLAMLPGRFQARGINDGETWSPNPLSENAVVSPVPRELPKTWTPFSWASRYGWQDALDLLLQQPEVLQNRRDGLGRSALSWTAGQGQEAATKLLMAQPETNLNEGDDEGRTPLSWAARNGRVGTMQILLSSDKSTRADPNLPDQHGRTPLSWAAANGHAEAVLLLIRHGKTADASLGELTGDGKIPENSPISWAARNGQDNVLGILFEEQLERGLEYISSSYLLRAAGEGWANVTKLLIQKGAFVDPPDPVYGNSTPLCIAAEFGWVKVVQLLLQADANRNYQTSKARDTPLSLAVRHRHETVVRDLLDAGADITLANARGETPMTLAQRLGHANIFNMIAAVDEESRLVETREEPYLVPSIDCEFQATVVHFIPKSGILEMTAVEVDVGSLLKDPTYSLSPGERPAIRWLHLPANNMRWIELLMMGLCESPAAAYKVLDSERWVKRQHHGSTGVHHARFMRPHCQEFPSASQSLNKASENLGKGQRRYGNDLVLFMPFLHWDLEDLRSRRESVIRDGVGGHDDGPNARWNNEQKLLKAYLMNDHPLHTRRTLDQYYYHTLVDTSERDSDQVVSRYQAFAGLRPRIITMVDQLWLWVLGGAGDLPDTVVTCFPHVGKAEGEDDADPNGLTDVLRRIKLYLLDMSFRVQTAHDLAGLIAATCSRIYLDPGSTLSFQEGQTTLQFAELYDTEISNIVQEEAVQFKNFTGLTKKDVADISAEIKLLARIKDVLDELNIMRILFGDQRKLLKIMDGVLKSASKFAEEVEVEIKEGSSWENETAESPEGVRDEVKAQPEDSSLREEPDSAKDVELEVDENRALAKLGARHVWGVRSDPEDFSFPLSTATTSLEEISAMIERAEKAQSALISIVDLKQKHNSVTDAQESLRQGRTVLVFTLATIIFLPLSFMASFFTLNIAQFQKTPDGQLDLGYVSYIIFPVSSVVSAVLIWVAFNVNNAEKVWKCATDNFKHALELFKWKTTQQKEEPRRLAWALAQARPPKANGAGDLEAQSKDEGGRDGADRITPRSAHP